MRNNHRKATMSIVIDCCMMVCVVDLYIPYEVDLGILAKACLILPLAIPECRAAPQSIQVQMQLPSQATVDRSMKHLLPLTKPRMHPS